MKKLLIFGFDGTIANTLPGMLYCFNRTATSMGYSPVEPNALYDVIGISLNASFRILYDMKDDEIEYAANNYSKLYSQKGKTMATLYDGLEESLKKLKDDGFKLAIATLKHKMYTTDILKIYKIENLFDAICATDVDRNLNKNDLIVEACRLTDASIEDSVLIGNNDIDAHGAIEVGMDFVAAMYGPGFKAKGKPEKYNCKEYINSVSEMYTKLKML